MLSKKYRMAAVVVIIIGAFGVGFTDGGFGGAGSPDPTVQAFLLGWQQAHYAQAAALTNGGTKQVSAQLAAAYTDLDATSAFFTVTGVTQHGDTAVASPNCSVNRTAPTLTLNRSSTSGPWPNVNCELPPPVSKMTIAPSTRAIPDRTAR